MESRSRNVPEMRAPSVGVIRKPEDIKSLQLFCLAFYDEKYVQAIVLSRIDAWIFNTNYIILESADMKRRNGIS